jgi:hypothetical protein
MNSRIFLFLCACLLASSVCLGADVPLRDGTAVHFASASEGSKILTTRDDFVRRLSPFDRAARVKVDHAVSEEEYLNFVGKNTSDWTNEEIEAIQAAIQKLRPLLGRFPLSLPPTIQMIKTTGAEEGNAAYTRETAIILPKSDLAKSQPELMKLVSHELFHVLSRHNPELKERLYEVIGFMRCDEIEFPRELASRKITNPDAPKNDHFIRLTVRGEECLAVPILFSTAEVYDAKKGGEFFEYLNFQFLVMKSTEVPKRLVAVYEDSKPKLVGPKDVSGFFEQVGRNTNYIIHPEEILAENFSRLVLKEESPASHEVLEKISAILAEPKKP